MSRYLTVPEIASPSSDIDHSFFSVPSTPTDDRDKKPQLIEQLPLGETIDDESCETQGPTATGIRQLQRLPRRRRILRALTFIPNAKSHSVWKRLYGLLHGHPSDVNAVLGKRQTTGWKTGLRWVTIAASVVLGANSIFLISTMAAHGSHGGIGTLYSGDCNVASNYDTGIHLLINVLSTILLGASSYVMQCLNSPTRAQIDATHAQGKSMDIGMLSFKNARRVGWRQAGLWALLGISALPLHVFWNSATFTTLQTNQYDMFVVRPGFSEQDFHCDLIDGCDNAERLWNQNRTGELTKLTNEQCISTYSQSFLVGYRNVLLVTTNDTRGHSENLTADSEGESAVWGMIMSRAYDTSFDNSNCYSLESSGCGSLSASNDGWSPTTWWCGNSQSLVSPEYNKSEMWSEWGSKVYAYDGYSGDCNQSAAIAAAADLSVVTRTNLTRSNSHGATYDENTGTYAPTYLYMVDHCLVERVAQVCQLQSAHYIWLIVIVSNGVQVLCMCLVARALKNSGEPIVVIGDAIASFLERPDANTEGKCLMTMRTATNKRKMYKLIRGRLWSLKPSRWIRSSSSLSYVKTLSICICVLMLSTVFFTIFQTNSDSPALLNLGFGSVTPNTILVMSFPGSSDSFSTLILVLLVVNSPQILFSSLYFMYNSLLTSMLAMCEMSRFAIWRRNLRVSLPTGGQRYTYWLHLPYTYTFPLLASSVLMHWFISQSLFLGRIQVIDEYGNKMSPEAEMVGYEKVDIGYSPTNNALLTLPAFSPKGIVCSLSLGAAMFIAVFGLGFRRYSGGVPLVCNNSLAISAMCHPRKKALSDEAGKPIRDSDGHLKWDYEKDAHLQPVMWGAVVHESTTAEGVFVPGHCTFTSWEVEKPIVGQKYA